MLYMLAFITKTRQLTSFCNRKTKELGEKRNEFLVLVIPEFFPEKPRNALSLYYCLTCNI